MQACSICGQQNAILLSIDLWLTAPWPLPVISQILSSIIKTDIIFKSVQLKLHLYMPLFSCSKIFLLTKKHIYILLSIRMVCNPVMSTYFHLFSHVCKVLKWDCQHTTDSDMQGSDGKTFNICPCIPHYKELHLALFHYSELNLFLSTCDH